MVVSTSSPFSLPGFQAKSGRCFREFRTLHPATAEFTEGGRGFRVVMVRWKLVGDVDLERS